LRASFLLLETPSSGCLEKLERTTNSEIVAARNSGNVANGDCRAHEAAQQLAALTVSRHTCKLLGNWQNQPHYFPLEPVLRIALQISAHFLLNLLENKTTSDSYLCL
jgi:hypothetical protein